MPDGAGSRILQRLGSGASAPNRRGLLARVTGTTPEVSTGPTEGEGIADLFSMEGLVGGAALLGAGLLARNPSALGRIASKLGVARQQLMLSGLAIPKAILGNIGGAAIESVERGTANPLRQLLSRQTLRDVGRHYKTGAQGHVQGGTSRFAIPGRILGAIDLASQDAFKRAGLSAADAERLTFQTPLGRIFAPNMVQALESEPARYLIPFRRTPFNVLYEGLQTINPANLKGSTARQGLLAASGAAGAAHGAATSDEQYPFSLGLGAATANRYALPYLLSAAVGRSMAGGSNPESVASEVLPISEYGLASGVTQPLRSFTQPAAVRVLRRLLGNE